MRTLYSSIRVALAGALGAVLFQAAVFGGPVDVGSEPPDVAGTWMNRDSTTLRDLKGYAVIVEFWATWCGPCVAQIPHLNELHEKYKDKGLVIIGVSDETKDKVAAFVAEKGMKYPIALDPKAGNAYGVQAIPHCVLVSPEGKAMFVGHPSDLKEELIEKAIETATFIPALPEKHGKYNALLKAKKFGKAYVDIKKAVADKKVTEAEAAETIKGIESRMKALLADATKAKASGDFYAVGLHLNQLTERFSGTEEAKKGAELLKEVEADSKARDQVRATATVEKLEKLMEARAFADAYKGYKSLSKKFPGTTIATLADAKVASIEKGKLLNYKPTCPVCKKDGKTCATHRV